MEKAGYRDQLALLREIYPDRITITPQETAKLLGWDIRTVRAAIARKVDPIPSVKRSAKCVSVPITELARWLCGGRRYG